MNKLGDVEALRTKVATKLKACCEAKKPAKPSQRDL